MSFPNSPHLATGEDTQIGIITLWTKKEHVMNHVSPEHYAVIAQLYSRDEGISQLVRSLLEHPEIRDLIVVGADLNKCADTLLALWKNGSTNGQVIGAPGYIDTELPQDAIDAVRDNVNIHDLRTEKDYAKIATYISQIDRKPAWGKPQVFVQAKIEPPRHFPTAHQHSIRAKSIDQASRELAHMLLRFGQMHNLHIHLMDKGSVPESLQEGEERYVENFLSEKQGTYGEHLHKHNRLNIFTKKLLEGPTSISFTDDEETPLINLIGGFIEKEDLHLTAHISTSTLSELPLLASALFALGEDIGAELHKRAASITISIDTMDVSAQDSIIAEKPHILRRQGDPKSNILIRLEQGRIKITHLSPDGKRLEEFTCETAMEAYKRLVVEHRITDLSHAAYIGYELGKAETALKNGAMYEQDA